MSESLEKIIDELVSKRVKEHIDQFCNNIVKYDVHSHYQDVIREELERRRPEIIEKIRKRFDEEMNDVKFGRLSVYLTKD